MFREIQERSKEKLKKFTIFNNNNNNNNNTSSTSTSTSTSTSNINNNKNNNIIKGRRKYEITTNEDLNSRPSSNDSSSSSNNNNNDFAMLHFSDETIVDNNNNSNNRLMQSSSSSSKHNKTTTSSDLTTIMTFNDDGTTNTSTIAINGPNTITLSSPKSNNNNRLTKLNKLTDNNNHHHHNNHKKKDKKIGKKKKKLTIGGKYDPEHEHTIRCMFCGGPKCPRCSEHAHMGGKDQAIRGLHSNWITDDICAMQRPSTKLIEKYEILEQFQRKNIKAIFNLTIPGEHPLCGHGNEMESGFPYLPEDFMRHGIMHYNYGWEDMTTPSIDRMKDIVKVALGVLISGGKIAIHCHAGYGRTGILVACILIVMNHFQQSSNISKMTTTNQNSFITSSASSVPTTYTPGTQEPVSIIQMKYPEVVYYIREKRPGSIQTKQQNAFVESFSNEITSQTKVYDLASDDTSHHLSVNNNDNNNNNSKKVSSNDNSSVSSGSTHVSNSVPFKHSTLTEFVDFQHLFIYGENSIKMRWIPRPIYYPLTVMMTIAKTNPTLIALCLTGVQLDTSDCIPDLPGVQEEGSYDLIGQQGNNNNNSNKNGGQNQNNSVDNNNNRVVSRSSSLSLNNNETNDKSQQKNNNNMNNNTGLLYTDKSYVSCLSSVNYTTDINYSEWGLEDELSLNEYKECANIDDWSYWEDTLEQSTIRPDSTDPRQLCQLFYDWVTSLSEPILDPGQILNRAGLRKGEEIKEPNIGILGTAPVAIRKTIELILDMLRMLHGQVRPVLMRRVYIRMGVALLQMNSLSNHLMNGRDLIQNIPSYKDAKGSQKYNANTTIVKIMWDIETIYAFMEKLVRAYDASQFSKHNVGNVNNRKVSLPPIDVRKNISQNHINSNQVISSQHNNGNLGASLLTVPGG